MAVLMELSRKIDLDLMLSISKQSDGTVILLEDQMLCSLLERFKLKKQTRVYSLQLPDFPMKLEVMFLKLAAKSS